MLRKTTTFLFVLLLTTISFGQESNDKISGLEHVSSNTLSQTITVHTYKLIDAELSGQIDDSENANNLDANIIAIVGKISKVDGVQRCTFDAATSTFTIVTSPGTDLGNLILNTYKQ
jgi:hypothetical protein